MQPPRFDHTTLLLNTAKNITDRVTSKPVLWTFAAVALVIALLWPTASSVIDFWSSSPTFTHGFLVFPAFLWLVWRKRDTLARLNAGPDWRIFLLVAFFGACWLISGLAGIQVGEHAALALIIMSTIWAMVGTQVAKAILFPILFLFFLAPVGEELVPYLMELTADVTVWAIRNTGIPIYRDGLFFSLPSGNWSVVEACSGINYLISSISLGSLYAYLNYSNYKTRAIFMLIATLLPIVANSVRAYLIVMLGHLSSNKIATGFDHLIYGWFFFGIVMFILFSIGSLFQDAAEPTGDDESAALSNAADKAISAKNSSHFQQYLPALIGLLLVVGTWPAWTSIINSGADQVDSSMSEVSYLLPQAVKSYDTIDPTASMWEPRMNGFDVRLDADYTDNVQAVRAIAFVYLTQRQGKEMINSANVVVRSQNEQWRSSGSTTRDVASTLNTQLQVTETALRSNTENLLVWQWYQVGDVRSFSPMRVKLLEMLGKLTLKQQPSVTYFLATENTPDAQNALIQALQKVLSD